jgi:uncharacterized protein YggT (Ycf19 family)
VTSQHHEHDVVDDRTVERPVYREEPVYREAPVYRDRVDPVVVDDGPTAGEMVRRFVTIAFGVLQALLLIRIILLLLVANQGNDVVSFVLGVTDPFVEPFRGMFQLDRVGDRSGSMLDVAAIVALIGWTLIEALILAVLSLGARRGEDATV